MSLKVIGQMLLLLAFLLSAAAIAEPSSSISAVIAVMVFVGFSISVTQSHWDWSAGYRDAKLELAVREPGYGVPSGTPYKCGKEDCACANNPNYADGGIRD